MAKPECRWESPQEWAEWSEWLAGGLHGRNRWRLPVLLTGILFARGRRTVTTWLRAVGISFDYGDYYYFLAALGRKTESVATRLLVLVLRILPLPPRLLAVIDDSPTKRYGPKVEGRGRPRKYGKNKLRWAKRAAHNRGWQKITGTIYGKTVAKTYKTFLATYRPAGGRIRVVLLREEQGWLGLFCTDPDAGVQDILEAFADRATIEQDFHDVKEVWGAGQQQVRNIWTNVAVFHLNLWIHTLVELWAWNRPHDELCDRSDSPWDDADRRPSQANRRKALRNKIMKTELSTITTTWKLPRKILQLTERLRAIAA